MNENNESLIGPSGMELLKKEIDGLEEFKKSRVEERYHSALEGLAYRWFEIKSDEFNQLKPEQIAALEILADQRTKKNLKIWSWVNGAFIVGVGITSFLISPLFLVGLIALTINICAMCDFQDDFNFRIGARELGKKFDPKLLLKTDKEKA